MLTGRRYLLAFTDEQGELAEASANHLFRPQYRQCAGDGNPHARKHEVEVNS